MGSNIHLRAPGNWINDPNGFIYYKGQYHLYYQYFPYGQRWGTMHWGHAVSKNLIDWEHKGIALFPSQSEDQNGCFSGSAVAWEDNLYLYYTGVRYEEVDPKDIHLCLNDQFVSSQLMISSQDGEHFNNFCDKKVIIPAITDNEIGDRTHTRDPKVWRGRDAWYMILGSTIANEKGKVLFYKSTDLQNWTYENSISKEEFGWMWECPDYFSVKDAQVLVFSPMGILKDGKSEENQAVCMLVDFQEEGCQMQLSEEYQFFDYGLDLYAPQSTQDKEGNRVVVAWARMPKAVDDNWIGMFCIPRIVEVDHGHIYFRVHKDVQEAFSKEVILPDNIGKGTYRICLQLEENESITIGGYLIRRQGNRIHADRSKVYPGTQGLRVEFETPVIQGGYALEIYVDENLIEIFINQGEYVLSNVVYGLGKTIETDAKNKVEVYPLIP